ncbi:MAG: Appr-1-p processing protein [candidate division Zixibacteria bacterium]|nr:Appr-1-p processing protein [candidate division Zixibacteria bacterium]
MEKRQFNKCQIIIKEGDITQSNCDAIVNAANNHLWMGSGVAGAIKSRGGRAIEDEAISLAPIEVGDAAVTNAGKLEAKYVIHGAVMGQDLKTDEANIRRTTISCLTRAVELMVDSVAFPAFGTGVGGFPVGDCAKIMLGEVVDYLRENGQPQKVEFVLFGEESYGEFVLQLKAL